MHCLANICYLCLEKENKLISDINSSLSVNKDLIYIIGYLPINLAWLKTKRIILICEECCLRLRKTYEFLEMCLKNSALLQGYIDLEPNTPTSNTANEAESHVHTNMKQEDINDGKYEPNIEETEDVYADFEDNSALLDGYVDLQNSIPISNTDNEAESQVHLNMEQEDINEGKYEPNIEETEDVFVDYEDSFVKEENTWKREEIDDDADYSMGNNSTVNIDKEFVSKLSVNGNTHVTNADCVSSGFTCNHVRAPNKNELNAATEDSHKCPTCNKSFRRKKELNKHTRIHTGEKLHSCSSCKSSFSNKSILMRHMLTHTGEKPYECSTCKKCFNRNSILARHVRIHTGEKPYECSTCKKSFTNQCNLVSHMRIHTGEKPYECSTCKRCFRRRWDLVTHKRTHSDAKPYTCSSCERCFSAKKYLMRHMRSHTGVRPYECSTCKKLFIEKAVLTSHMRIHTGEKPYECSICKKGFVRNSDLIRHMRVHTGVK